MPYTNDIEGTQTPDSKQETNDMECPWLNRPNPIKPNAKVSKFEKGDRKSTRLNSSHSRT